MNINTDSYYIFNMMARLDCNPAIVTGPQSIKVDIADRKGLSRKDYPERIIQESIFLEAKNFGKTFKIVSTGFRYKNLIENHDKDMESIFIDECKNSNLYKEFYRKFKENFAFGRNIKETLFLQSHFPIEITKDKMEFIKSKIEKHNNSIKNYADLITIDDYFNSDEIMEIINNE